MQIATCSDVAKGMRIAGMGAAIAIVAASHALPGEPNRGALPVVNHVRCAQERGQALGACEAEAVRGAGGAVRVVVVFPNGFSRALLFEDGAFVRASPTMSGVGKDTDWWVEDGRHVIRVEDQRYEVPVALVAGE